MKKVITKIVAIATIVAISVAVFAACNKVNNAEANFDRRTYGNSGLNFSFDGMQKINKSIAQGGDKIEAALHIWNVANNNLINSPTYGYMELGGGIIKGGTNAFTLQGNVKFGNVFIKVNNEMYKQVVAEIQKATFVQMGNADITSIGKNMFQQADRIYTKDGEKFYVEEVRGGGCNAKMVKEYPFGEADYTFKDKREKYTVPTRKQFNTDTNRLKDVDELTRMIMTKETIDTNTVSVEYNEAEKFYTVKMAVDVKNPKKLIKAQAQSVINMKKAAGSDNLTYGKYSIELQVYENGTAKVFKKSESWAATMKVKALGFTINATGASETDTEIRYSWDKKQLSKDLGMFDKSWAK